MVRKIVKPEVIGDKKEENKGSEPFVPAVIISKSVPVELDTAAKTKLTPQEYEIMTSHIKSGGFPLSISTAMAFFELYLNGYNVQEIHRLNSAFPVGAIYWAKVQHDWDAKKDTILNEMVQTVREKVLKAQLETTGLMSDILIATNKRYRDRIKKYLQTGDEKMFDESLNINSIQSLLKLSEGLLRLTGQDNKKDKNDKPININVNTGSSDSITVPTNQLTPEEASAILETLASSKRRHAEKK
jgi:hypothetical protein